MQQKTGKTVKRIIQYIFGITLLVLGVIGLFLPFLQGILMIIAGLLILAPESKLIQKMLGKLREKYPVMYEKAMGKKKKDEKNINHGDTEARRKE